ncbi:MgtC/SapB family protein [Fimbriiglobus ruber]|uniref:Protein MgtC n=1 Tax=Fimbriiglobus ruber TaxID=1908690 RepID=A0A225E0Y5_9BACT|nr:MgtC/SapB family protein [Fimbriiglobus ruber]OWK43666.1 Mg(2+) transport ATPase protein C [Fimbriiglobus ruber]
MAVEHMLEALALGVLIGIERQFRRHPAGIRTNALVAVGAALFISVAEHVNPGLGTTQIAANVVSGIGFLGAGVILREGINIRGLNTAATLWCSAAVGVLCGCGRPEDAAAGTVVVIFTNYALRPLVKWIDKRVAKSIDVETLYHIQVICPDGRAGVVRSIFLRHVNSHPTATIQGVDTRDTDRPDRVKVSVSLLSTERNDRFMEELVARLSIEPDVTAISWQRDGQGAVG